MNLTLDKLKSLLKKEIKNIRFEEVTTLFKHILEIELDVNEDGVKIGDNTLKVSSLESPTIIYFGPCKDNMTRDSAYSGIEAMAEKFTEYKDLVLKIGSVLGGFDFNNHKMMDKHRIISNKITSKDDYSGSLTSQGQSRHPSSHFADNTYFFNIMYFIQHADDVDILKKSNIVLRYPGQYFKIENDDEDWSKEYRRQNEILEYRFPPKFLWMWANKDTVIHPISLMAFRNFLNTEYGEKILKNIDESYTPKSVANMKFDDFTKAWKKISNRILNDLIDDYGTKTSDEKTEIISKVSKLISEISIEETDIKNISDLLQTGNKAVILWGPPGTGKTYESMQVVKEIFQIEDEISDEDLEKNYLFSSSDKSSDSKGYYEIIQFHPNYTYQDFIGGISPKLGEDGNSVSYELKEGIFKQFCDDAGNNKDKKYVFIIDEINRAELSAVFGELLFALEYRGKSIKLPNFDKAFTIPENVYIIGTMNNVDKSLVTFDLALRRRFGFFKLMPELEVINDSLSDIVEEESLNKFFEKAKQLNDCIKSELGLGEDYQIGQAYFLKIKDFLNQEKIKNYVSQIITSFELEKLWIYNIEPLLEEYLGMSIEDESIQSKLKNLKDKFLNDK